MDSQTTCLMNEGKNFFSGKSGTEKRPTSVNKILNAIFCQDSVAYNKMKTTLTKPRLLAGIMNALPVEQTSSLEGFHSVVNQFSPKMISYSFPGMFCR